MCGYYRFRKLLPLIMLLPLLFSCVSVFAPYYQVDFTAWPGPVLLNAGNEESGLQSARVFDTRLQTSMTQMSTATTTDAYGTVWTTRSVETWSVSSSRAQDTPPAVQLYTAYGGGEPPIRLRRLVLDSEVFFYMGVAKLATALELESVLLGGVK